MYSRIQNTLIVCAALVGTAPVGAAPGIDGRIVFAPASYIGIGVMDISDETARDIGLVDAHGIEISSVAADSPAEQSGLREGDIVLTYRGERVQGYQHFARLVRETPVGRSVELGLVRDGQRTKLKVEIGEREVMRSVNETIAVVTKQLESVKDRIGTTRMHLEAESPRSQSRFALDFEFPQVRMNARNRRLGTDLESLDGQLAAFFGVERGVLVRHVRSGSISEMAGLQAGDVIVSVAGEQVDRPSEVGKLAAASEDRLVAVEIVRDRAQETLRLDVGSESAPHPANPVSTPN